MGIICSANCSLELETSRASPSYVAAQLSLFPLSLTISPSAPQTTLLFFTCSKCKIILFPFTTLTEAVPHVRLKVWLASFDLLSTILILIKRLHPSLHDLNWTKQPFCSERDHPLLSPSLRFIHTKRHNLKKKQKRSNALLNCNAVNKMLFGASE